MIITLLVALASVAVSAEELPPTLTETKVTVGEPATLVVANRHIIELRAQFGAMTPERRVEGIERRIANLPLDTPADKIGMQPGTMGRLSGYWIDVDGLRLLGLANEESGPPIPTRRWNNWRSRRWYNSGRRCGRARTSSDCQFYCALQYSPCSQPHYLCWCFGVSACCAAGRCRRLPSEARFDRSRCGELIFVLTSAPSRRGRSR